MFFDIACGEQTDKKEGRVQIRLYEDLHPIGSENFRKMCEGYKDTSGNSFSYKNKEFVNSLKGYFSEIEEFPETIYGKPIANESYEVEFDRPGVVGMSRTLKSGMEESNSGFFITLQALPGLHQHVAIGEVTSGLDFFKECNMSQKKMIIKDCGFETIVQEQ